MAVAMKFAMKRIPARQALMEVVMTAPDWALAHVVLLPASARAAENLWSLARPGPLGGVKEFLELAEEPDPVRHSA